MAIKTSLSSTGTLTLSDIGSVFFPGTNDFLIAPSSSFLAPGSGDFTIEAWVYPTAALSTYNVVYETATANALLFGKITNGYGIRSTGVADLISSPAPSINQWVHIAATRNGTSLRIFINGELKNTVTDSTNFVTGQVTVGANIGGANPFTGYISNLRFIKGTALYSTSFIPSTAPLTPVTNTQLLTCQAPSIRDVSTNNFSLSINGNPVYNNKSPFTPELLEATAGFVTTQLTTSNYIVGEIDEINLSGSLYFDAVNDYVSLPASSNYAIAANQDFTMECWVNLTVLVVNYRYMVQFYDGGSILEFRIGNAGFGYRVQATFGPSASANSIYENVDYTHSNIFNKWAHLALCRSGTTTKFFFNGIAIATRTSVGSIAIGTPISAYISNPDPYGFQGYISNFRLIKNQALYTSDSFTPPTTALSTTTGTVLLMNMTQGFPFIDSSVNSATLTPNGTVYNGLSPFAVMRQTSTGNVLLTGIFDEVSGTL